MKPMNDAPAANPPPTGPSTNPDSRQKIFPKWTRLTSPITTGTGTLIMLETNTSAANTATTVTR